MDSRFRGWPLDPYQVKVDLAAPLIGYVHANSIEEDSDGNRLLSSRHLNETTKIDRDTGDIIWRMGRGDRGWPRRRAGQGHRLP